MTSIAHPQADAFAKDVEALMEVLTLRITAVREEVEPHHPRERVAHLSLDRTNPLKCCDVTLTPSIRWTQNNHAAIVPLEGARERMVRGVYVRAVTNLVGIDDVA